MVWDGKLCCDEFDLRADICNVGSDFLATDYEFPSKSRH